MPSSFLVVGDAANEFHPGLKEHKVEEMNLARIDEIDQGRESREDGGDGGEIENSNDEISDDDVSIGSNYLEEFLIPNSNPDQPPTVTYEMHVTAMRNLNSRWEDEIEHTVHESEKLIEQQNMVSKEERDVMQIRHQNEIQQALSVAMENEEQMLQMKTEYEDTLERQSDQIRHLSNENKELIQQLEEHQHGLQSAIELAIQTVQKELEESAREEQKSLIDSLRNQMKNERKKSEAVISNLEQQIADTSEVFHSYKNEKDSQKKELIKQYKEKIDTVNQEKDAMQKSHIEESKQRNLYYEKLLKKTQKQADADYRGIIKAMKQNMNDKLLQMKLEYESLLLLQNPTFNTIKDRSFQSKEETIIFDLSIDSNDSCNNEEKANTSHVDTSLFMNEYYDSQTMQNHLKNISNMIDTNAPLLTKEQAEVLSIEIKNAIEVERINWDKKLAQTLHAQQIKHDLKIQQTMILLKKQQQVYCQQNTEKKVEALNKEILRLENANNVLEVDLENALRAVKEYKILLKQKNSESTPSKKKLKGFGGLKTYWEGASSQQQVGACPAPNNNNTIESISFQQVSINVKDAGDDIANDNDDIYPEPTNGDTNGHFIHDHRLQTEGNLGEISSNNRNPGSVVICVDGGDNVTNAELMTNGALTTLLSSTSTPQALVQNDADVYEINSVDTEVHQNTSPVPPKSKKHVTIVKDNRPKKSPTSQRSRSLSRAANPTKNSPTKSPSSRSRSLSRVRNTTEMNSTKSPNSRSRSLSRVRINTGLNSSSSSDPEQKTSMSKAASENKRSPRAQSRSVERRSRNIEPKNNARKERSVSRPPGLSRSKHNNTKKSVSSSRLKTNSTNLSNDVKLQRSKDKNKPQSTSNNLRKLSQVHPTPANMVSTSIEKSKNNSIITNLANEKNENSASKDIPSPDPTTFKDTRIMVLNMTLNPEMRKVSKIINNQCIF